MKITKITLYRPDGDWMQYDSPTNISIWSHTITFKTVGGTKITFRGSWKMEEENK